MKCSILSCSNVYDRKFSSQISYHGFPNNPEVLTMWVCATGIPAFIPTHNSKVCSIHFDESAYQPKKSKRCLIPEAIPTKFLPEIASEWISDYIRNRELNSTDPVLDTKPIKGDTLMQNSVPSSHNSTVVYPARANPIKVVDLDKLLPKPQNKPVDVQLNNVTKHSPISNSLLSKYSSTTESFVNSTGLTVSRVLTCLQVLLPSKFNLSRMVANDKGTSVVIRYLKQDEKSELVQTVVRNHLEIITEASKRKDKKSVHHTVHPYTKITDQDLKRALALILPGNFSMTHITDELLRLICVTLDLDICTDAYYMLIRKIRKFTSEGQKFSEILNCDKNVHNAPLEVEKHTGMNTTKESVTGGQGGSITSKQDSGIICGDELRRELVFVDVNNADGITHSPPNVNPLKLSCEPLHADDSSRSGQTVINVDSGNQESIMLKTDEVKTSDDKDLELKSENKIPNKSPDCKIVETKLEHIILFLRENNCTAKDVLHNFQLMFKLCRSLQHQTGSANTKNVKSRLNFIIENNIDVNNYKRRLKQNHSHFKRLAGNKIPSRVNLNDAKLKMKPMVVLRDSLGFKLEHLIFMRREKVKSNGFYDQSPFSSNRNPSNKKYSTEQVRELTDDSFKRFRRIVMKRDGTKAVFVVKFAKLDPGTVVYAKNFRHPEVGWVKGLVNKSEGPLKYQVKLDNDSLWSCTVDQLRPVLN